MHSLVHSGKCPLATVAENLIQEEMNRGNHGVNNILHVPTTTQKAQHLIVTYLLRHIKILVCPDSLDSHRQ